MAQVRRETQRGGPVKNGLNTEFAGKRCIAILGVWLLTMKVAGPYKDAHTARRPLSARLRAPEAPHFRVELISEKVSGVMLRRLPGLLGSGSRKAAGLFDR